MVSLLVAHAWLTILFGSVPGHRRGRGCEPRLPPAVMPGLLWPVSPDGSRIAGSARADWCHDRSRELP